MQPTIGKSGNAGRLAFSDANDYLPLAAGGTPELLL